jgi:hypothetical protein
MTRQKLSSAPATPPSLPLSLFRSFAPSPCHLPIELFRPIVLRCFSGALGIFGVLTILLRSCFFHRQICPSERSERRSDATHFYVPLPACKFAIDCVEDYVCGAIRQLTFGAVNVVNRNPHRCAFEPISVGL